MRDEITIETPEQIRALAYPLRQRILDLVADAPYTNKQLATTLKISPSRLHFHIRTLLAAGLIEVESEQRKRGVLEKYYRAVARMLRLSPSVIQTVREEDLLGTTLEAISQEYARARGYFSGQPTRLIFMHEAVRVSPERLARIRGYLSALADEIDQSLTDPKRETYEDLLSITYLLHSLPPITDSSRP